jgi:hypothetical protein
MSHRNVWSTAEALASGGAKLDDPLPPRVQSSSKLESNSLSRLWGEGGQSDGGRGGRVRGGGHWG